VRHSSHERLQRALTKEQTGEYSPVSLTNLVVQVEPMTPQQWRKMTFACKSKKDLWRALLATGHDPRVSGWSDMDDEERVAYLTLKEQLAD